jgi:uncharacterized membrane protein YhaH (DUF805 family)
LKAVPSGRSTRWPFLIAGVILLACGLLLNEWTLGLWFTRGGHVTNSASRLVLLILDLAAIAAGLALVVRRDRAPWRQMLLAVMATGIALMLAEGGLRLLFAVKARVTPPDRVIAEKIGWRPVANVSADEEWPGFGRVHYTTTHDGFRVFGDPHSTKSKVLVLGDSYTEARTISDGETYYQRLAEARPDLEVFAIGGGGYGTLQEYMLLDEWVDTIKPDWVLLQMHPNDLVNNSHALESRSTTNNNQMTRPYWEHGRVVMRFPENAAWGPIYNLVRHSYLLRLLNVNLSVLRADAAGSVERSATSDDPDVREATDTTVELLALMHRRANAPVVVFSAKTDGYFPFWLASDVCRRAGVIYLPGVGEAVDAADAAGEPVTGRPVDAHWNGGGHALAARVIANWLAQNGLPSARR